MKKTLPRAGALALMAAATASLGVFAIPGAEAASHCASEYKITASSIKYKVCGRPDQPGSTVRAGGYLLNDHGSPVTVDWQLGRRNMTAHGGPAWTPGLEPPQTLATRGPVETHNPAWFACTPGDRYETILRVRVHGNEEWGPNSYSPPFTCPAG